MLLHITMYLLRLESAGLTGSLHRGTMKLICLTLAACVATAMAAMAPGPAPMSAEALVSYNDMLICCDSDIADIHILFTA